MIDFFSGVLFKNFVFSWHKANVRSINWLEDDVGFVTTAADNSIAVWHLPRLSSQSETTTTPIWTFT